MIPFNKACVTGKEITYIQDSIGSGQIAGDGKYTKLCQDWFSRVHGFEHNLLTTSCSMSLDMSALLLNIKEGDEVILPSFTFVSTANAFVLRGAKIKFVDIRPDTMNLDENKIEAAITKNTKVIVPVHYAGVSCEMDKINEIATHYKLAVVEDAAQGMMSRYKGKLLGGLGDIGCYSFHGTKNYTSGGEGGLIIIKSKELYDEAEIIREKGTNRKQFFRGAIDKYTWVNQGSSYLPSDISAAYLYAQLEHAEEINKARLAIWYKYFNSLDQLKKEEKVVLPTIPKECIHNAHMFYMKLNSDAEAKKYIDFMKSHHITTPFHYVPLHTSPAGLKFGDFIGEDVYTTLESSKLVRLPIYYNMSQEEIDKVIDVTYSFFKIRS